MFTVYSVLEAAVFSADVTGQRFVLFAFDAQVDEGVLEPRISNLAVAAFSEPCRRLWEPTTSNESVFSAPPTLTIFWAYNADQQFTGVVFIGSLADFVAASSPHTADGLIAQWPWTKYQHLSARRYTADFARPTLWIFDPQSGEVWKYFTETGMWCGVRRGQWSDACGVWLRCS